MAIFSMTGFASTTEETQFGTITTEVKSVNSRFLDLQFRINDEFRMIEPVFREALSKKVSRGKVECRFSFSRANQSTENKTLNQGVLDQIARFQAQISQQFPSAAPLSSFEILKWNGLIEETEINADSMQEIITNTINKTLNAFVLSREREGQALADTLLARVTSMEEIVAKITPLMPTVLAQFQQKATARLEEALGLAVSHGETNTSSTITRDEAFDRIRQEVTMYGIRADISEELNRLAAHLTETRHILKQGGQVGKRLDFMMQELNREANTLGSKAANKELADASMALKLLIEQMREQVQNIE